MKCRTLNRKGHATRWTHRLWCRTCRNAQDLDTMIGFGMVQMQDTPPTPGGMAHTLAALDLQTGGKAVRRAARRVGLRRLANMSRAALFGLCGVGIWAAYMDYTPALHIPAKQVPAQNALDYFKTAGKQLVYEDEVGTAPGEPNKDAKPGPPNRHLVTSANLDTGKKVSEWRVFEHDHLYTLADKQMLLDENRAALATFRAGLKYPYMDVYVRSFNTRFDYYTRFRAIARLLSLESQVRAARGDWGGAMQSGLDSVELGVKIPRGASLIGRLVGIACEAIGRKQAWKAIPHLNAFQTRAAIARLESIRAQHTPYVDTMQEEIWGAQTGLREIMKDPKWRLHASNFFGSEGDNTQWQGLLLFGWSNRIIINDMTQFQRETLRRARLPYYIAHGLPPIPEPFDPMCAILFPVFEQARYKDIAGSETQDALLLTSLALHAYALDNGGAYPDTLAQIAPKYIANIPADPLAMGVEPLRYKRLLSDEDRAINLKQSYTIDEANRRGLQEILARLNTPDDPQAVTRRKALPAKPPYDPTYPGKGAYVLYSVGPDGKDDGGLPVDSALRPLRAAERAMPDSFSRYTTNADSLGDIVAGLNSI